MLTDEERKEAIEKALRPYIPKSIVWSPEQFGRVVDALAEAIVIPVEIEHILPGVDPVGCPNGYTIADGVFNLPYPEKDVPIEEFRYEAEGIHGKPGKAIVIIIPEEE